MTIDQLVIYREKIRSVSVPEAVHYLLGEIDRFMDENARLTAEVAEAKEYIRQLEMGHGNKEDGDE